MTAYCRGQTVSQIQRKGAMLAVGLGPDQTTRYPEGQEDRVDLAAINSGGSITLSGDAEAIDNISAAMTADSVFNRELGTGGKGCDLALDLESTSLADLSITDRFFHLTRIEARRKCLLPGDVKSVEPLRDSHGGVQWQLQLTEEQKRDCRFLVCASAVDPNTVTLLPLSWSQRQFDNHIIYNGGDRWYFSTQNHPAFPPQWALVLLPHSR